MIFAALGYHPQRNGYLNHQAFANVDVHENTEAALRITKALFGEEYNGDSILRGNKSIEAKYLPIFEKR